MVLTRCNNGQLEKKERKRLSIYFTVEHSLFVQLLVMSRGKRIDFYFPDWLNGSWVSAECQISLEREFNGKHDSF